MTGKADGTGSVVVRVGAWEIVKFGTSAIILVTGPIVTFLGILWADVQSLKVYRGTDNQLLQTVSQQLRDIDRRVIYLERSNGIHPVKPPDGGSN